MTSLLDLLDTLALERGAQDRTLDRTLKAWAARLDGPPEASAEEAARCAIFRAIRLDLALIVRDPSLLFACLHQRAFWHGSPEAQAFYGRAQASPPAPEPPLRDWVERWRSFRKARGASMPWGRSLRPPEYPLDAPILEEYREDLSVGGALRFSEDGGAVGLICAHGRGERSIAWDRRTGQRLTADEVERLFVDGPAPPPLELERAEWGHCRVRDRARGERIVDLELGDDASLDYLAALPDGGILVAGWKDDYDGVVFRLDPPYQAARWSVQVGGYLTALAVWACGRVFTVSDGHAAYLLDAGSGERLARVPVKASGIALDASGGLLATLQDDLIRVWDVAALGSRRCAPLAGCGEGWIDAQFSPDGRRLLTGEILCDADDGRLVARLDLDGPGYLEGGPPSTGRHLADGRFVEMAPLRGVCVWETEGGQRVLKDETRRYGNSDNIVISPDGLYYLHTRERFLGDPRKGDLELRRTDDGQLCARLALAGHACARFSPTGARVVAGALDGAVVVFSVPEGRPVLRIAAHAMAITEVVFSRDERLLLTSGRDGMLRLWEAASGRAVGERALGDEDPVESHWTQAEGSFKRWSGTAEALARVEGWLGFSTCSHPYVGQRRRGLFEVVDARSGRVLARVPTHHRLIADGTGARWAFRSAHFAVEQE